MMLENLCSIVIPEMATHPIRKKPLPKTNAA